MLDCQTLDRAIDNMMAVYCVSPAIPQYTWNYNPASQLNRPLFFRTWLRASAVMYPDLAPRGQPENNFASGTKASVAGAARDRFGCLRVLLEGFTAAQEICRCTAPSSKSWQTARDPEAKRAARKICQARTRWVWRM